jgi:type I restriction-modification system DNA methylase subunit
MDYGISSANNSNDLVMFDESGKYVTYMHQKIRRNYENPEEKVQAAVYQKLVRDYGYPPPLIRLFVPVRMGSDNREADLIVYKDEKHLTPFVVVECKKDDVSELEFQRAVDQAFSYAVAEGASYVWITSGLKNEYYEVPREKPKDRVAIPDIPRFGVKEPPRFRFAKSGGAGKDGQRHFDLEKVSEDELTRRFRQAHQALWGGGELNPSEAFDELDKLIFCKIWDERKPRKPGEPYDFQVIPVRPTNDSDEAKRRAAEETSRELLDRLHSLYDEGRKKDPEVFKDGIRLNPAKARAVVGYLQGVNLMETDLDSKGRAFETFMGSFFRGDFGQYFTPRPIVKFIVDVLPITHDSKVLDTSCGSGGFLLHALDKVRREAGEFYAQGTVKYFNHWHDFAERQLFGIEINEQIARTAKMNMIIHDDGHTNVVSADGLLPPAELVEKTGNKGFAESAFDFIITNPPFGSVVKQTEKGYLHQYGFASRVVDWLNPKSVAAKRPNQNTEILFIEQASHYLRPGGYLAVVIPDGILTNSSLQYVRDGIEELFRIVAVVSMPQTAFAATGAGVKSSVLFLRRHSTKQTEAIHATKTKIQNLVLTENKFTDELERLEKAKKRRLKELEKRPGFSDLTIDERKADPAFKEASRAIADETNAELEKLRAKLEEQYAARRSKELPDYEIFMAIAEDIGYDATGKPTKTNELDPIAIELAKFIAKIEEKRR